VVGGIYARRGSAYEGSTSRIPTLGHIALFRRAPFVGVAPLIVEVFDSDLLVGITGLRLVL